MVPPRERGEVGWQGEADLALAVGVEKGEVVDEDGVRGAQGEREVGVHVEVESVLADEDAGVAAAGGSEDHAEILGVGSASVHREHRLASPEDAELWCVGAEVQGENRLDADASR